MLQFKVAGIITRRRISLTSLTEAWSHGRRVALYSPTTGQIGTGLIASIECESGYRENESPRKFNVRLVDGEETYEMYVFADVA